MSEFVLSLEATPRNVSEYGIAAVLSRLAGADGRPTPAKPRKVTIPGSGELTVPAEPGAYRLEAYLPSGLVQDLECEVPDARSSVHVRVGSAEPARPATGLARRSFAYSSAGGMCAPASPGSVEPEAHVELTELAKADPASGWKAVLSSGDEWWRPLEARQDAMALSQVDDGFEISSRTSVATRYWSRVSDAGRTRIASLPFEPFGRGRTVEISQTPTDRRLVTLVDSRVGAMLTHIAVGHTQAAIEALRHIEADVEGKRRGRTFAESAASVLGGPIPSCAAAYAATMSGSDDRWAGVVGVLASIGWLPDGALLAGHDLLRRRGDEASWRRAAELLRTAVRRGVPYFTLGVGYLIDDLSILVNLDGTLEAELSMVRSVARRTCRDEAFTVVDP